MTEDTHIPCPRCDGPSGTRLKGRTDTIIQYRCCACSCEWFVVADDPLRDRPFSDEELLMLRRLRRSLDRNRRPLSH
jgi:hypothetical protein